MKRIIYATAEFTTDDDVADALLEYASVLAIVGSADVVRFPGLDSAGTVRQMQIVIGPASQLLAMDADSTVDLHVEAAAAEIRERARRRLPASFEMDGAIAGPAESDAESTTH
jgi:hypothetical protein